MISAQKNVGLAKKESNARSMSFKKEMLLYLKISNLKGKSNIQIKQS
jgi:hypothetical protein